MTFRGLIPRAEWGARKPRSRSYNITPVGTLWHWTGTSVGRLAHPECYDAVRTIQNIHMSANGWVDIAYSMLPCRHGWIFAGRGKDVRTAANGTNAANSAFHAACYVGGQGDGLTADGIDAMWAATRLLGGGRVAAHSDFRLTACPGDEVRAAIDAGNTRPGTLTPDIPGGTSMHCKRGDTDNDYPDRRVSDLQVRLRMVSPAVREKVGPVDGVFGWSTARALAMALGKTDETNTVDTYGPWQTGPLVFAIATGEYARG